MNQIILIWRTSTWWARIATIVFLVYGIGLLADMRSQGDNINRVREKPDEFDLHMAAEKYIKAKMRDPSSAVFRNQFIGKKGAPCGEVNAKNGFGGYTGFQRYIVIGPELAVLDGDMAPGEFETSWYQICK